MWQHVTATMSIFSNANLQEQEEAMQQLRDAIRQLYDARQRQVKAKAAEKQILEARFGSTKVENLDQNMTKKNGML